MSLQDSAIAFLALVGGPVRSAKSFIGEIPGCSVVLAIATLGE